MEQAIDGGSTPSYPIKTLDEGLILPQPIFDNLYKYQFPRGTMAKKGGKMTKIVKEKTTIYKSAKNSNISKEHHPKPLSDREIQLALIENFVNLQKVMTNMAFKFDSLSNNISSLLQLYETAARSFVKNQEIGVASINPGEDKDLIRKLDTLLDQNKTIAKGLTLIEEKIKHKVYGEEENKESHLDFGVMGRPRPRPLPKI